MIIYRKILTWMCNWPVSRLSYGAVARKREKIYDVVILDPISGLRCDSTGASKRAGVHAVVGMCMRNRTYVRVWSCTIFFVFFFDRRDILISADGSCRNVVSFCSTPRLFGLYRPRSQRLYGIATATVTRGNKSGRDGPRKDRARRGGRAAR